MGYQFPPDVENLVAQQMRGGLYASTDDVLREALRALVERNNDLEAIGAGIEDMVAGRVVPLGNADAEIRAKLGFKPPQ